MEELHEVQVLEDEDWKGVRMRGHRESGRFC